MTDQNQDRLATRGQRRKIRAMLDGDLISFELAQALIEGSARIATEDELRTAVWEVKFPNKGAAIMEVLRPFYDWKPELKPVLPNLEEQVKNTELGKLVSKIRVFPLSQEDLLYASLSTSFEDTLRCLLTLEDSLGLLTNGLLLMDALSDSLMDSIGHSIRDSLCDSESDLPWLSLFELLRAAVACINLDKLEVGLGIDSMLELWLKGNFPIGFDKDGNLLVLVAG